MNNPIPPDSTAVNYKCKICGKDGITYASNQCDEETVKKLSPMLTCDPCHTHHVRRRDAIEQTGKAAAMWVQHTTGPGIPKPEIRAKIASIVEGSTKRLAVVIAEKHRSNVYHWDKEVVEYIMDKPRLVYTILREMERTLDEHHAPNPENS